MDENEVEHFVYVVANDGEERHALQTRASWGEDQIETLIKNNSIETNDEK